MYLRFFPHFISDVVHVEHEKKIILMLYSDKVSII